jgi:tetratricopeptide (TPR) repeat protein
LYAGLDKLPPPYPSASAAFSDGVTLLQHAAFAPALVAASEACRLDPQRPQHHYLYGQAWSGLGDHLSAERAFAEAVRLRPTWADAWVNYGLARYRQGAIEDAKTAMRQALRAAPGHAAAASNLAAFLRISGEADAAEDLLRDLLRLRPDDVGARLNLAADLLLEERAEEALALLGETLAAKQARVAGHWSLQRALALLQLRRAPQAAEELARFEALGPVPPALAPLWRWRGVLLASLRGDRAAAFVEAAAMEQALGAMGADAVPEHAIMSHFDLAKFFSAHNARARGFSHWVEGHRLLSRMQPFSRENHHAFVDACVAEFTAARFARGPRAANADPAPVFIVGMPRSGTTLAEQILGAHADCCAAGERPALARLFHRFGDQSPQGVERLAAAPQSSLDAAAGAYLAELHALAPQKRRIVDKMPGNFNYLGLVGLILPGARILHCARDPRDVGLSIFTFRFHGQHGYAHKLEDLGWYICEHDRLMRHWKAELPNPILTVKLSDWVDDFDATLRRVLQFCELPQDENCSRFYETDARVRTVSRAQVRQPVNSRGIGRWKSYAQELRPLIAELDAAGALDGWSG